MVCPVFTWPSDCSTGSFPSSFRKNNNREPSAVFDSDIAVTHGPTTGGNEFISSTEDRFDIGKIKPEGIGVFTGYGVYKSEEPLQVFIKSLQP